MHSPQSAEKLLETRNSPPTNNSHSHKHPAKPGCALPFMLDISVYTDPVLASHLPGLVDANVSMAPVVPRPPACHFRVHSTLLRQSDKPIPQRTTMYCEWNATFTPSQKPQPPELNDQHQRRQQQQHRDTITQITPRTPRRTPRQHTPRHQAPIRQHIQHAHVRCHAPAATQVHHHECNRSLTELVHSQVVHACFPTLPFERLTPAEQLSAVLFNQSSETQARVPTATVRKNLQSRPDHERPEVLGQTLTWRTMPARTPRQHTPRQPLRQRKDTFDAFLQHKKDAAAAKLKKDVAAAKQKQKAVGIRRRSVKIQNPA